MVQTFGEFTEKEIVNESLPTDKLTQEDFVKLYTKIMTKHKNDPIAAVSELMSELVDRKLTFQEIKDLNPELITLGNLWKTINK